MINGPTVAHINSNFANNSTKKEHFSTDMKSKFGFFFSSENEQSKSDCDGKRTRFFFLFHLDACHIDIKTFRKFVVDIADTIVEMKARLIHSSWIEFITKVIEFSSMKRNTANRLFIPFIHQNRVFIFCWPPQSEKVKNPAMRKAEWNEKFNTVNMLFLADQSNCKSIELFKKKWIFKKRNFASKMKNDLFECCFNIIFHLNTK